MISVWGVKKRLLCNRTGLGIILVAHIVLQNRKPGIKNCPDQRPDQWLPARPAGVPVPP